MNAWIGRGILWAFAFACALMPLGAEESAEEAALLETMKARDRAIQDVVRSETKGETEAEREQLKEIVGGLFDFGKFAEVSLGRYWAERSEVERAEFVGLCRRLIEKNYGDPKLYTKSEKIDYIGVEVDGTEALLKTVVHYKNEKSAIEYKLTRQDDVWLIYDMVIDDLSIARNNRSQFYKEIRKSSYEGLVQKLKDKLNEERVDENG